ncbi:MAG: hypothetical protein WDO24_11435 [Pseudomonadota bacterium]
MKGIEDIIGLAGNDTVVALTAISNGTIDLGGGTDSLVLSGLNNTFSVTNAEAITGSGASNDSITLTGITSVSLSDGGGNDTLMDTGSGNDTIALGAGSDSIVLGSAMIK